MENGRRGTDSQGPGELDEDSAIVPVAVTENPGGTRSLDSVKLMPPTFAADFIEFPEKDKRDNSKN